MKNDKNILNSPRKTNRDETRYKRNIIIFNKFQKRFLSPRKQRKKKLNKFKNFMENERNLMFLIQSIRIFQTFLSGWSAIVCNIPTSSVFNYIKLEFDSLHEQVTSSRWTSLMMNFLQPFSRLILNMINNILNCWKIINYVHVCFKSLKTTLNISSSLSVSLKIHDHENLKLNSCVSFSIWNINKTFVVSSMIQFSCSLMMIYRF